MRSEPPEPLTDGWARRHRGGVTALVRRDFLDAFRRHGLIRAADLSPGRLPGARTFRPEGGRGELAVVPAGALGEAVVRPYRRGGLPGRWVDRRYLLGNRAFREVALTERLRRAGVPVPEPLAAVQSRRRPGYRAALVTRRVRDAEPAPARLTAAGEGERREDLRRMGRAVGLLHRAGGYHPDLNAHNFLLPSSPAFPNPPPAGEEVGPATDAPPSGYASRPPAAVLLDLDRARRLPVPLPGPLARWNLRRLRRSFRKLGLEQALEEWDALEAGHREGRGADRDPTGPG